MLLIIHLSPFYHYRQRKHRRTSDHGVSRESTSSLLDSLNIAQSKLIQEETYEEGKVGVIRMTAIKLGSHIDYIDINIKAIKFKFKIKIKLKTDIKTH